MSISTVPDPDPIRVAVQSGLPATTQIPLTADLVALIQAQAEARGQRLERFELHAEGSLSAWQIEIYWVVSDLPRDVQFRDLAEARRMLGEQLHVRLSGGHDDTQDGKVVARELKALLRMVEDANARDGVKPPKGSAKLILKRRVSRDKRTAMERLSWASFKIAPDVARAVAGFVLKLDCRVRGSIVWSGEDLSIYFVEDPLAYKELCAIVQRFADAGVGASTLSAGREEQVVAFLVSANKEELKRLGECSFLLMLGTAELHADPKEW